MRKIILQFIIFLMLIGGDATAQNLIAVQNGDTPLFYTLLDSAIFHAQNGDTIYLPGGNFTIGDTIDKCLHFVGVGHDPDSAYILSRTLISGGLQMILKNGADNGSVTGIYFNDPGYYGYDNIQIVGNISNYSITRNFISKGISISGMANNISIIGNIIVNLSSGGLNVYCSNNLLLGYVGFYNVSTIKNNIFAFSHGGYSQYTAYGIGCLFENNIFKPWTTYPNYLYSNSNVYYNNLNAGVNEIVGTDQGSNNFLDNTELPSVFVNYLPPSFYGESADFHLPLNSPYKNAGTDGTDIGIYGGSFPWKEGSIPFNPHIQHKSISGTTDNEGNLNVNIKVSAQDR